MTRVNQGLILLFAMVVVLTLIRFILPYGISEADNILPNVYSPKKKGNAKQHLTDILAHNLWDEGRGAIVASNNGTESDRLVFAGSQGETHQESASSALKLVGVSRVDGFAVVESAEGIKHYATGALLPDGSRLDEVLEYGVRISKSGKNELLYLFGKN